MVKKSRGLPPIIRAKNARCHIVIVESLFKALLEASCSVIEYRSEVVHRIGIALSDSGFKHFRYEAAYEIGKLPALIAVHAKAARAAHTGKTARKQRVTRRFLYLTDSKSCGVSLFELKTA